MLEKQENRIGFYREEWKIVEKNRTGYKSILKGKYI